MYLQSGPDGVRAELWDPRERVLLHRINYWIWLCAGVSLLGAAVAAFMGAIGAVCLLLGLTLIAVISLTAAGLIVTSAGRRAL